jgi:hypothetical protein
MPEQRVKLVRKSLVKIIVSAGIGASLILGGAKALGGYENSYSNTFYIYQEQQKVEQADLKTVNYSNAMSASTIDEKVRLLEDYLKTYSDSQYHKFAHKELAFGYYGKKNYDKVIDHGDKALTYSDLDNESKAQLFLVTGESYVVSPGKKNLDKAADYAGKAEQIIKSGGLGEGYLKAVSSLESLIEKAKGVGKSVSKPDPLGAARSLYNKKDYVGAEKAFAVLDHKNPDAAYYYGLALYQNKKYNESVDKLLTASILDSASYPKAMNTASSIFLNNVYKESKSGKGYSSLVKETNDLMNNDIMGLQKAWNDKYADKELDEEEAKQAETDKAALDKRVEQIRKDTEAYQLGLKKAADAAFNNLVSQVKQRLDVK